MKICQTYSLAPEELLWKLEALNYRPSQTRSEFVPITMDTLASLRTQLDQKIKESTRKALQSQKMKMNRNIMMAPGDRSKALNAMGRGPLGGGAAVGGKAVLAVPGPRAAPPIGGNAAKVKNEAAFVGVPMDFSGSSSSSVVFVGPKSDAESKAKRACEHFFPIFLLGQWSG